MFSWDMESKPKAPKHKYNRLCRHCQIWLTTVAEERIGIHIACVQALNIRNSRTSIMRPGYGSSNNR